MITVTSVTSKTPQTAITASVQLHHDLSMFRGRTEAATPFYSVDYSLNSWDRPISRTAWCCTSNWTHYNIPSCKSKLGSKQRPGVGNWTQSGCLIETYWPWSLAVSSSSFSTPQICCLGLEVTAPLMGFQPTSVSQWAKIGILNTKPNMHAHTHTCTQTHSHSGTQPHRQHWSLDQSSRSSHTFVFAW